MISAYEVYQRHHALKLHFTTKNYDYIKYHGKTRFVSESKFITRKDRGLYYRLGVKYGSNRIEDFFVANMVKNPSKWIGEYYNEESVKTYDDWVTRTESIGRYFEEDLEQIFEWCVNNGIRPDSITTSQDGKYPLLFNFLIKDLIFPETYVIFDRLSGFTRNLTHDDAIYNEWSLRIQKYKPFVKFNGKSISDAFKRCINTYAFT